MRFSSLAALNLSIALVHAISLPNDRIRTVPDVPSTIPCPGESQIRPADSLNLREEAYVKHRRTKAAHALSKWLTRVWGNSSTLSLEDMPNLALALSGGGPKAGLTTAGAVYGLDGRENSNSVARGLLQAMTYVSALSGGSLTLSGMMANDFSLVSTLKKDLYDHNYQNLFQAAVAHKDAIAADVSNKAAAGYPTSLIDAYGRDLAYNFIASNGASGLLWSNVILQPSFKRNDAPFPIITITEAQVPSQICEPYISSPIWEISPLEIGSWDTTVNAFYPTKHLGTRGGQQNCTVGFDSVGFVSAVSSNILVNETYCTTGNYNESSLNMLASVVHTTFPEVFPANPYGIIPNPFHQSSDVHHVIHDQENIYGTDGGDSFQAIPMFPLLQPERDIDIILVVDALTYPPAQITNGEDLYNTYFSAQTKGLLRMPVVPTVVQFASENLSASAHFYGCHDPKVATLIYTPNTELGGVSSSMFFFTPEQINSTFQGGVDMVTQKNDDNWAACVACVIMHNRDVQLPDMCGECLMKYCWMPPSNDEIHTCVGSYPTDVDDIQSEVPCGE